MSDSELIDLLGGPAALAAKLGFGARGVQRVSNWKRRGIPARVQLDHAAVFRGAHSGVAASPASVGSSVERRPADGAAVHEAGNAA